MAGGKWDPHIHTHTNHTHDQLCVSLQGLVVQRQGQLLLKAGRRWARDVFVWALHGVFGASKG